jgi:hypothetical protein
MNYGRARQNGDVNRIAMSWPPDQGECTGYSHSDGSTKVSLYFPEQLAVPDRIEVACAKLPRQLYAAVPARGY